LLDPYFEEATDTIEKAIESKKNLVGSTTWKQFKVNSYESQEFNAYDAIIVKHSTLRFIPAVFIFKFS